MSSLALFNNPLQPETNLYYLADTDIDVRYKVCYNYIAEFNTSKFGTADMNGTPWYYYSVQMQLNERSLQVTGSPLWWIFIRDAD